MLYLVHVHQMLSVMCIKRQMVCTLYKTCSIFVKILTVLFFMGGGQLTFWRSPESYTLLVSYYAQFGELASTKYKLLISSLLLHDLFSPQATTTDHHIQLQQFFPYLFS